MQSEGLDAPRVYGSRLKIVHCMSSHQRWSGCAPLRQRKPPYWLLHKEDRALNTNITSRCAWARRIHIPDRRRGRSVLQNRYLCQGRRRTSRYPRIRSGSPSSTVPVPAPMSRYSPSTLTVTSPARRHRAPSVSPISAESPSASSSLVHWVLPGGHWPPGEASVSTQDFISSEIP
jgi:hypothetical protein